MSAKGPAVNLAAYAAAQGVGVKTAPTNKRKQKMNENENKESEAQEVVVEAVNEQEAAHVATEQPDQVEEPAKAKRRELFARIAKRIRSAIPVKKTLVVVQQAAGGIYKCWIFKYSAKDAFKKAAIAVLLDKTVELDGELGFVARNETQVDLVVRANGRETVAYSAVAV